MKISNGLALRIRKKPVLCNYYLTYRCNAACGFCDIWEKPSPYIQIAHVESNLNDLKRLGVQVIDFTGGEPLLHPEIERILAIAKAKGFITTLTTNALLYPKKAVRLKGLIDMLHFSLDSSEASQHNAMRKVDCFDKVMESIEIALQLGEKPDILCTVFDENIDELEKIYHQICLPNKLVLIVNPAFDYNQIQTSLSSKYFPFLKTFAQNPLVYLNEAFLLLREEGGNHTNDPVCRAASTTLVISPKNELILPCYHLGTRGFAIENNLFELYHQKEVQALIALEGRLPACEGCVVNCYMQPSFAVEVNRYFWKALPSTLKYNRLKGTWKKMMSS